MPDWVNNRIFFDKDIPQEKFEEMLLGVLRKGKGDGKVSNVRLSISEAKALSNEGKIAFDFNALIPMPAELNLTDDSKDDQIASNISKYGYRDWYAWSLANWGTKWNSQETRIDWENREIFFQTANSEPTPIIFALHTRFPDAGFEWNFADSKYGCGVGVIRASGGKIAGSEPEASSSAAHEIYVKCWGESDCLYQDDDGKWHKYDCDDCPHPC